VVMPHANFPKVTWMIFVKVDPVVMHATSITPASWVLPVLADAAVAVAYVAPKFPGLPQSGWLCGKRSSVLRPKKKGGVGERGG
jgi:hypothetical protein